MQRTKRHVRSARQATAALRQTIDEIFAHLIDTVPWDVSHVALGAHVFRPFELTCRVDEVWTFWREHDVAAGIVRRSHLAPLDAEVPSFDALFEAALAMVAGEATCLPAFARPDERHEGPRVEPPRPNHDFENLSWRPSLRSAA